MEWSEIAGRCLLEAPTISGPIRDVLEQIRGVGLQEVTRAIDPGAAMALKEESTRVLLFMIRHGLEDHTLTEQEIQGLRTIGRVFRIDEGDLVRHHRGEVSELLCREAELIFRDQGITTGEAVHKARLQEVFGLGYDEFIGFLEPEVERLVHAIEQRFETGSPDTWLGTDWEEIRDRLAALSFARHVQALQRGSSSRSGYIYLMVNPSMPGMVKIGRTSNPPLHRAAELTAATGVPTPFTVAFELFVPDQFAAEAHVHEILASRGARISEKREFFAVGPSEAIQVMLDARDST